ncbi:4Fe-4S binding protein [Methanolobus sp. WCC5]|uniref:4Fe-4S binding protein n=1 Tax=Methanolobus sp. WCC5 TaxID=3125785 RepID=UPI0032430260
MVLVAVYENKCTGCGLCVDACPNDILELISDVCVPVRMGSCKYCMDCVAACEFSAIKVFI